MVTVTSLYICISYIYTYSYNFYYLSSLHSYCMSIFSVTCSMSLVYLLSILLLYSCLSHILCLFLVICLYLILDLFHIVFCIMFFASFLYFHVHFLSCSYTVHESFTLISHILSYNLSYIVLYFYLHSYTFYIRYFCTLSYDTFHVLYFHMFFTCF